MFKGGFQTAFFYFCTLLEMKKFFVIIVLFALPLVAYLFFASGVNNFARLPVLEEEIQSLESFRTIEGESLSFSDQITILGFPGKEPLKYLTNAYHLAEKIYDPYSGFNDLYLVSVVPEGSEEELKALKEELGTIIDLNKWKFVTGKPDDIRKLYADLRSDQELADDLFSPDVFIIDKQSRLRGRTDDEDEGRLAGYDTGSIAVLNNKMNDDVKVILAEYRLELKKYKDTQKK